MAKHRDKYKAYTNGKYSFTSSFGLFDEFGYENCKIEWVENFPCNSRQELTAREGYYIRNCECINKRWPAEQTKIGTMKTLKRTETKANNGEKKNHEYKIQKDTEYREAHREEMTAKLKEKKQCECGCYIPLRNMSSHKRKTKHIELMKQNK